MSTKIVAHTGRMLEVWRKHEAVPKVSFRLALTYIPGPSPEFKDALDFADMIGTLAETPRTAQILWADATVFARNDPDITAWAPYLIMAIAPGISDPNLLIDGIFRLARAIDLKDPKMINQSLAVLGGMIS